MNNNYFKVNHMLVFFDDHDVESTEVALESAMSLANAYIARWHVKVQPIDVISVWRPVCGIKQIGHSEPDNIAEAA